MTIFRLPLLKKSANQSYSVPILDKTYVIKIRWHSVTARWNFSLYDQNNNPILLNKYLTPNVNILKRSYANPLVPDVDIKIFSLSGDEPDYNNLGTSVNLYIIT